MPCSSILLKKNGLKAELEKHDGFKTVDIVIENARVHIEVDGGHHNYSQKQALADLKRTFHSFKKGYLTLRIPNSLIKDKQIATETAKFLAEFLEISESRQIPKSKPIGNSAAGYKYFSGASR